MLRAFSSWTSRAVVAVMAVASVLAFGAGQASAAGRTVNCAGKVSYSQAEHLGPTYVEALSVGGTTCKAGESLIKAYNTCRLHNGGTKGHCTKPVDGFRCSEKRSTSPTEFAGKVACTRSRPYAKVTFTYIEAT